MRLRTQVLRGGAYLALRQGLGVVVGAVGIVLLTRALGPAAYGIYAAGIGIYTFLSMVIQWGLDVFLIRQEGELEPEDYDQAFSLLLLLSLVGTGGAFLALPLIERWVQLEGFGPVASALFVGLPITVLGIVPRARLERALDYRSVALTELSAQLIFYLVALPLAYKGLGPWAPVGGLWTQQVLLCGLLYRLAAYRPRLYWESARVRAMVGYGFGYSTSIWVWQLRTLVNPLVVGRYAGADAVGYVALAIRLVEQLSFARVVAWRLSIAALARLQTDRARLAGAATEGMIFQIMAIGPFLAGFALAAPWIFPLLFSPRWTPVLSVYPFIALGYLSNSIYSLHASALYVLRKNWAVTVFGLVHVFLFAGSAMLLVPQVGLRGYGWAEVAALPSYAVLHILVTIYVGRPRLMQVGIWFMAWAVPLFGWQLGPWAWTSLIVPLILPATRKQLLQAVEAIFAAVFRTSTEDR